LDERKGGKIIIVEKDGLNDKLVKKAINFEKW